jgi:diadenosine tetraphosphate (Ap4A) HIT family hydrolase
VTLDRLWAGWRASYIDEVVAAPPRDECLFCALGAAPDDDALVVARNEVTFAVLNAYPYTCGHVMVAPVRHEAELDGLDEAEATSLMVMMQRATTAVRAAYAPEGMNVGVNIGRAGGAGVPGHLHVHVLPRWAGDTNFMTSVAETRVLPEPLATTLEKLRAAWPS